MKKAIVLFLVFTMSFLLTGCSEEMISETGYDLSPLEECIDSMVDQDSNFACDTATKNTLIEEYVTSFMAELEDENTQFNRADLTYSMSKDGITERIEFWFQFSLLPSGIAQDEYETFLGIIQTMSLELREMNDVPEFIFTGEFLFMDDIAYKFHHDNEDKISGEILIWGLLSTFELTYNSNSTFLLDKANAADDMISLKFLIMAADHSVEINVDKVNGSYNYLIYRTDEDAIMPASEVNTIIETSLNTASFTIE